MEQLSVEDYVALLNSRIPDISSKSLEVLKREEINGRRAKRMGVVDFHSMSISYGDAKDIIDFNENYKPEPSPMAAELHPNSQLSASGKDLDKCMSFDTDSEPNENDDFSDSNFEEIASYFSNFSELSDYEKITYLTQKRVYEEALSEGKLKPMPVFMTRRASWRPSGKPITEKSSGTQKREKILPDPTSTSHKKSRQVTSTVTASSSKSVDLTSSRNILTPEKNLSSDNYLSTDSSESSNEPAIKKRKSKPKKNGSKTLSSEMEICGSTSHKEIQTNTCDKEEPDKEPVVKTNKKRKAQRKKVRVQLSEEEYAATLPKYAVDDILKEAGRNLKAVRNGLREDGVLFGPRRKLMIRTLVYHLYYKEVSDVLHVTVKMREGLACSIVSCYPEFKSSEDPTKRSWWRLFDPSKPSGSIQNVVKAILNHLSPDKRPRGGGSGRTMKGVDSEEEKEEDEEENLNGGNTDITDPNAEWMSLEVAYDCNKKRLMDGMKASRDFRKTWIRRSTPYIADVLKKYPHLMSFDGEVIEQDFEYLFPKHVCKFIENFPSFLRGLNELEKENIVTCDEIIGADGDVISACLTVSKLLPRPNLQRFRRGRGRGNDSLLPDIASLVHIIPANTNIKDEVNTKRVKAGCSVQPYLLGLVPEKTLSRVYIVVDSKFIDLGKVPLLKGLDMLFKVFHVFNAEYPLAWKTFWEFVEHGIYLIEPLKLTNSGNELIKKVKALQTKKSKQ